MFWRVYLYGLILLAAVAMGIGVANKLLPGVETPWSNHRQIVGFIDEELTPLLADAPALEAKLERVHRGFGIDLAVYRSDGALIGAAGRTPSALAEPPANARWLSRWEGEPGAAIPIDGGRAYVVAGFEWGGAGLRFLLVPLVVLGVLALVTLPLARTIVRPIERVTQAARALGEGDLSVRTGLDRQDEVGTLARAFDDMAARLERLVEGERELLANVSHELRTPLSRIRVALEIVEEGADDPEALRKHLRGIRGDLAELEELVAQVLITAKLDLASNESLALAREPVAIEDIARASAARFAEHHPQHELELRLPEEPGILSADPKLIRRVIDNLLDNAAKYAEPSSGLIELTVGCEAELVRVEVSDRGDGVDAADIDRLFEPFFRADSSRARGTGGVGLGLTLCKRVVEAHGGTIEAEHRDGGGLTVRFHLPLA